MERENDRIEIPERFLKMSQDELNKEKARLLAEMKKNPKKGKKPLPLSSDPKYIFSVS